MDLYFVRHGATHANLAKRHQAPNEPLSDTGTRDVAKLVRTIQELEPTHLYTSHFTRARQTAHYLSYATGLEAEWIEDVSEIRYPEYMHGKRRHSLSTLWYGIQWFQNAEHLEADPVAESRREFFARVKRAQAFFAAQHTEGDRVVVVSHSFFINAFIVHLCRDEPLAFWRAAPYLKRILMTRNTGITHVRHLPNADVSCGWQLVCHNNTEHLINDVVDEVV